MSHPIVRNDNGFPRTVYFCDDDEGWNLVLVLKNLPPPPTEEPPPETDSN